MDKWQSASDKIRKFETEVLKKILPHARLSESSMFGSPDEVPSTFKGKISSENIFKGTQYEYTGDGNFIHFTSLTGLKAILDSGWLRMSEFGNLVDGNELVYAASIFENEPIFNVNAQNLQDLKENVFCLSACEANDQTRKSSFLWEVYGDKGKGVTIEYSFTNNNPFIYIIGKTQYGIESFDTLKTLKLLAKRWREENENFFPSNFNELILEIQAFHKAKQYAIEQEVRMFLRVDKSPHEEHNRLSIYQDINNNQEVKYFNKIFLKGRHEFMTSENIQKIGEEAILRVCPQVEISRITLGFNISVRQKVDLHHFFAKLKEKFKYDFEVWQITPEERIVKMI